jgi:hypothetical protein
MSPCIGEGAPDTSQETGQMRLATLAVILETDLPDGTCHEDGLFTSKRFIEWISQPAANGGTAAEHKYEKNAGIASK